MRSTLPLACLCSVLGALSTLPAPAAAQTRAATGRARMEISFDQGWGFGSEGHFVETASDLRVLAPEGFGVVLRAGAATNLFSTALALDLGVAAHIDLHRGTRGGVQLNLASGLSYAYGPFDVGYADAVGGFAMGTLEVWNGGFFIGLGATTHTVWVVRSDGGPDNPGWSPRETPVFTVTPTLRIGGDWGL